MTGLADARRRGHDDVVAELELDVLQLAVVACVELVALEAEGIAEEVDRGAQVAVGNDR